MKEAFAVGLLLVGAGKYDFQWIKLLASLESVSSFIEKQYLLGH